MELVNYKGSKMVLKGKKDINIGDLIKKAQGPATDRVALVVKLGADNKQAILANWVRVRYVDNGGYEWIQKHGIKLMTKD